MNVPGIPHGPAPLLVGACAVDGAEGFFAGLIDEVRVSDVTREGALGTVEVGYTYNARNQLVTETSGASVRTYSYDMNGNTVMIAEAVNGVPVAVEAMAYDELNRMTSYAGPRGSESFTYRGAEWQRFSANGTAFLYDGDNVVQDIGGPGGGTFYVTPFLDQNLSMTTGATPATHYYSHDGLGSVRTLTDSSGSVKNRYDYAPFGRPFAPGTSATVKQRYTYTGREQNPVGPTMYYRYRQYDPRAARFLHRDLVFWPGDNAYEYAGGNPLRRIDPLGLRYIGVEICVDTKIAANPRAWFNANKVERELQKLLDQCPDPCKRDKLVARVKVCSGPPAEQGIVERDISIHGNLPWYGHVALYLLGGLGGGTATEVGMWATSADDIVESWQGYVEPGTVGMTGLFKTKSGSTATKVEVPSIPTSFDRANSARYWAEAIAHEQLWLGLLAQDDTATTGKLSSGHGSWSTGNPMVIPQDECNMLWKKLRE